MRYPKFLKNNATIGICAPSAGMGGKLDEYLASINVLKEQGYSIKETASVRNDNPRSNTATIRAEEINELVKDENVDMIFAATGGDVELETVPYVDYESIDKNPKWIMGYSDPTNLLFPVTTMLDIATLYGFNGSSFEEDTSKDELNCLEFLKGNLIKQESFDKYRDFIDVINEVDNYKDVYWNSSTEIDIKGRCIGGCLDVIEKLVGTKYGDINSFIDRYKDDGIVWYFDNFAMSAYNTYLTLLQFKNAGFFRHCKAVLIGRVAFPNTEGSDLITSYEDAYKLAFDDIPYISEMDIGHTEPRLVMINGAIINVECKDGKGSIEFELK